MNNIPSHLQGLNAVDILHRMRDSNQGMGEREYVTFLEMHLLLAISHALSALTDREVGLRTGLAVESRAVTFLKTLCPSKKGAR